MATNGNGSGRPHQQEELDLDNEDPQSARRGITDPDEITRGIIPLIIELYVSPWTTRQPRVPRNQRRAT